MIRQLRRRHLRIAIALAVVIPVLLAFAAAARREFPRAAIPAPVLDPSGSSPQAPAAP